MIKSVASYILGMSKTAMVWPESMEGAWFASLFENWSAGEGPEGTGS